MPVISRGMAAVSAIGLCSLECYKGAALAGEVESARVTLWTDGYTSVGSLAIFGVANFYMLVCLFRRDVTKLEASWHWHLPSYTPLQAFPHQSRA